MRHINLFSLSFLLLIVFSSCESYLTVELRDQISLEEVFSKRITTEKYLAQVYGQMPNEYRVLNEGNVPCTDEASFSWKSNGSYTLYVNQNNGSWNPTINAFHKWEPCYKGINQATIFMDNVDKCLELTPEERADMKAEARFIRAYLYFVLVRKYGPVFIWGDKPADQSIKPETIDRHSLDHCIDFIVSEYDKAALIVPETIADPKSWAGRITKGAILAAKSRLLLYAARPLFNGCDLYKGMKNMYGEFLFPQIPDPNKWQEAADAAKAVIDMPMYKLYEAPAEADKMKRATKSYMGVIFEEWNSEIIWGSWQADGKYYVQRTLPHVALKSAISGFAPSLKLVDAYPMATTGRFPITGYNEDGTPIIDPKSGYKEDGFTAKFIHPIDSHTAINAHNSCVGRDARFYASILASGMYWINTVKGKKLITFNAGGTSPYVSNKDCSQVGYLWRRMTDPTLVTDDGKYGTFCWPIYRLAEIYLNYAEACNEKPIRDEAEALKYINKIRSRSGLNDLEVAYPEVKGDKKLLRELIRKERMVELAFENLRFYDNRTCMTAKKEEPGIYYSRNVRATKYTKAWDRVGDILAPRVFEDKHYLFPIHQNQLKEMVNITQNYGW